MASNKRADVFAARIREIEERWAGRAEQERVAWLNRPRLHTALFEEVWNYHLYGSLASLVSPEIKSIIEERLQKLEQIKSELDWSDERLASFQKLIVDYRRTQNATTYLKIRRDFPEIEIQVSRFGGIDFVFTFEDDLKRLQISPDAVAGALDCDEPWVDALCLRLLTLLVERDALPKTGPGHIDRRRNAISDSFANYLISIMLESYDWHEEIFRIPPSLIVLARRQLTGENPDLYELSNAREKRQGVAFMVAQKFDAGERLTVRKLANVAKIPRSTAARWLTEGFQKKVEDFRRLNELAAKNRRSKRPAKK
jgi:hypothetical protein